MRTIKTGADHVKAPGHERAKVTLKVCFEHMKFTFDLLADSRT